MSADYRRVRGYVTGTDALPPARAGRVTMSPWIRAGTHEPFDDEIVATWQGGIPAVWEVESLKDELGQVAGSNTVQGFGHS